MGYEVVKYEVAEGVATVTLNNPEKRNMLSGQMLVELVDAMKTARDSEDVRAVVLTAAGDKVFCAGADLGGFAADVPLVAKHFASDLFLEFFRLMPRLGKPSLCAAIPTRASRAVAAACARLRVLKLVGVDWLPEVVPSSGVIAVSHMISFTLVTGTHSSSATNCVWAVSMPCPISHFPV